MSNQESQICQIWINLLPFVVACAFGHLSACVFFKAMQFPKLIVKNNVLREGNKQKKNPE